MKLLTGASTELTSRQCPCSLVPQSNMTRYRGIPTLLELQQPSRSQPMLNCDVTSLLSPLCPFAIPSDPPTFPRVRTGVLNVGESQQTVVGCQQPLHSVSSLILAHRFNYGESSQQTGISQPVREDVDLNSTQVFKQTVIIFLQPGPRRGEN